jgi:hypothetical protein
MGRFMSVILWIILILRIAIAILLASLGISTILAMGYRMVFQPPQGDLLTIGIWMAKPLAMGIILLVLTYWVSNTLTRFQKFTIVTIVFLISAMSLYSLASGMDWTASLQVQNPGIFSLLLNVLNQINTMVRGAVGL